MAVFPRNLQKNIRELDRQISLLETECENMEAEKREVPGKVSPKQFREGPGNPPSIGGQSPTRAHAAWCGRSKWTAEAGFGDVEKPESGSQWRRLEGKESGERGEGGREVGSESEGRHAGERREGSNVETKKPWKHSMESVKEVTESSEDNSTGRLVVSGGRERIQADKQQERGTNGKGFQEASPGRNPAEPRCSSDEEPGKSIRLETKSQNAKWSVGRPATPEKRTPTKRRSRSARTRTQNSDESPFDVTMKRAALEKEIQCRTWNEAKAEQNVNESVRVLHYLVEELRTKSTRERRNELLNDMQNVLVRIGGMKSGNIPQGVLTPVKGSNARSPEGCESTAELKKALIAVKKLYKEQSEEKSALAEELSKKNSTIACLENKEKEYLSLISNMKFNLEKMKKKVEEGKLAKRELTAVKKKLREEAKVIEALKKSHGKMQALVEAHVLENEKLRSEVNIGKLETRKFEVLLAGREAEIRKRKQEIELFQRQITQQLHLLRRKATENEVEHAIEAISNQANILQTDVESVPSETTLERGDPGRGGSSKGKRAEVPGKEERRPLEDGTEGGDGRPEGEAESLKLFRSSQGGKDGERKVEGGLTPCKSEDSESEVRGGESQYSERLHGVLSSSKALRININEMLKGMRRDSPEKFWPSPPNSSKTSRCSGASTYSEDLSECTQRD